jgi:hypothetical protein
MIVERPSEKIKTLSNTFLVESRSVHGKAWNATRKYLEALESKLKAAEEKLGGLKATNKYLGNNNATLMKKLALSVPFEVVQRKFRKCGDCGFNSEYCMKVNCPIIPKAKTDD